MRGSDANKETANQAPAASALVGRVTSTCVWLRRTHSCDTIATMRTVDDRSAPTWWDQRYREGSTPWDQGTVAPEVMAFAAAHPSRGEWALDIGCGSGAHSRELARHGYQVVGIDLSHVALQRAVAAARAEELPWLGVQASAPELALLRLEIAVALDVGCFHGLGTTDQARYAQALARRLQPGGFYLLYVIHAQESKGEDGPPGVEPQQVQAVFKPYLRPVSRQEGWQDERRADWWLWQKA